MEADGSDEMVHYGHCTLAHVATRLARAKLQSHTRKTTCDRFDFQDIFKRESMDATVSSARSASDCLVI